MRGKVPGIFDGAHGLNSQNLMRMLYTPSFLAQGNKWVGGWADGWRALAGNPTNLAEALGGTVDVYTDVVGILKDANEKFA